MALSRVLKLDITLLAILLGTVVISSFLIYAGNRRFVGILGIAVLASLLIAWRILTLVRQNHAPPPTNAGLYDFGLGDLQKKRPPRV